MQFLVTGLLLTIFFQCDFMLFFLRDSFCQCKIAATPSKKEKHKIGQRVSPPICNVKCNSRENVKNSGALPMGVKLGRYCYWFEALQWLSYRCGYIQYWNCSAEPEQGWTNIAPKHQLQMNALWIWMHELKEYTGQRGGGLCWNPSRFIISISQSKGVDYNNKGEWEFSLPTETNFWKLCLQVSAMLYNERSTSSMNQQSVSPSSQH